MMMNEFRIVTKPKVSERRFWCGYVGVWKNHPLWGVDYETLRTTIEDERCDSEIVNRNHEAIKRL